MSGNSTKNGSGGGLATQINLTLTNSTIAFNTAGTQGGGIYLRSGSTGTIRNSIIAQNQAPTGADLSGTFDTIDSSLIQNVSGATLTNGNSLKHPDNGNITGVDPLLFPLADNGGPTQTHALQSDSPAINAGNNGLIGSLTTDQRGDGFPRISDGHVDIGAFEFQFSSSNPSSSSAIKASSDRHQEFKSRGPTISHINANINEEIFPVQGCVVIPDDENQESQSDRISPEEEEKVRSQEEEEVRSREAIENTSLNYDSDCSVEDGGE